MKFIKMNVAILPFYYFAASVFLYGTVRTAAEQMVVSVPSSSWYIPTKGLPTGNTRPEMCVGNNSTAAGLCITWSECVNDKHGIPTSIICPDKKTMCCVFHEYKCKQTTVGTYVLVTSPGYPAPFYDLGYCTVTLSKTTAIRMYRMDFLEFNMARPSKDTGVCETDRVIVTVGAKSNVICGPYNIQHIIYRMNSTEDVVKLKFITTALSHNWKWRIMITHWPVGLIPVGCTQYFPSMEGTIRSTAYTINGRQLVDDNYKICIHQKPNICSVKYQPCENNTMEIYQEVKASDKVITPIVKQFQYGGHEHEKYPDSIGRCIRYEQLSCKP